MVKFYFQQMTNLIEGLEPEDFGGIWDEFWTLSGLVDNIKHIEWYDPDTTYFEDIMARYDPIKAYLEK